MAKRTKFPARTRDMLARIAAARAGQVEQARDLAERVERQKAGTTSTTDGRALGLSCAAALLTC